MQENNECQKIYYKQLCLQFYNKEIKDTLRETYFHYLSYSHFSENTTTIIIAAANGLKEIVQYLLKNTKHKRK